MIETERRTGAILGWVALALATASLVLSVSGVTAPGSAEVRTRAILSPLGLILLTLSLVVRPRSGRLANGFLWLSMAVLSVVVVLLLRNIFFS